MNYAKNLIPATETRNPVDALHTEFSDGIHNKTDEDEAAVGEKKIVLGNISAVCSSAGTRWLVFSDT